MIVLATELIEQVPVWAWWVGSACVIGFTVGLLRILIWFLSNYITENKESWKEIKIVIQDLVIVTTKHHERLDHHDDEIQDLKKGYR